MLSKATIRKIFEDEKFTEESSVFIQQDEETGTIVYQFLTPYETTDETA